ncbi:MAG: hypothetical protein GWN14_02240, partial [candidate division Zixibacteria bacterium]|nr:hypothetical protein [Gammaproteobacteria bacterium]NIX54775.1 hypothetical protein [candidate division Zixibacteria bacterium]
MDENFIQRQKFKTLTDLAERASRLPNQSGARLLYTQALDEATETHSLIGMSDILRLEKIKSAISKTVQIGNAGNSIQLYSSKESRMATTDGKEWQVTSTSGNESMKIRISSDLVVAGRVVNSFSRLSAADSYVPYIFLNNGSLKLFKEQQPEEEILKTAKFLEGI